MSSFRRVVIGIAQVALVLSIVGFTILGGFVGLASKTPMLFVMNANGVMVSDQVSFGLLCFVFGMIGSFLIAAVLAAFMFTLFEIADNTRATRQVFERMSAGRYDN